MADKDYYKSLISYPGSGLKNIHPSCTFCAQLINSKRKFGHKFDDALLSMKLTATRLQFKSMHCH